VTAKPPSRQVRRANPHRQTESQQVSTDRSAAKMSGSTKPIDPKTKERYAELILVLAERQARLAADS
jgi:hypothetical protein